jgi:hypothetical protein
MKRKEMTTKNPSLHSVWDFPSDHLPIGTKFIHSGIGSICVLSWNMLNKNYMKWIIKNQQGLNGSYITATHDKKLKDSHLDEREFSCLELLALYVKEKSFDFLCLQEVSNDVYKKLQSIGDYSILKSKNERDLQIILYNSKRFTCLDFSLIEYKGEDSKCIIRGKFKLASSKNIDEFMVTCTHVPFKDPIPITDLMVKEKCGTTPSIVCGDFNKDREELKGINFSDFYTNCCQSLTHITGKKVASIEKARQFDYIFCNDFALDTVLTYTELPPFVLLCGTAYNRSSEILYGVTLGAIEVHAEYEEENK